jgi:hypothetical protein
VWSRWIFAIKTKSADVKVKIAARLSVDPQTVNEVDQAPQQADIRTGT